MNYRLIKKCIVLVLSITMVLSGVLPVYADSQDFDSFLTDEWKELMESDYMTLHASVKDYKTMGLKKPDVNMGEISYEEIETEVQDAKDSLEKLQKYDFDSLSKTQQYDYLVYKDYLEKLIGIESYPDYIEMFRPITGSLTACKDYMLDFALYSKEDLDDYITLVSDFPRAIDEMIAFTQQQADKGYIMDNNSLDEAIGEIDDFVEAAEENEMIVVFDNTLETLDWLSDADRKSYSEQNRKIVLEQIIPAYERAADALDKMHGKRSAGSALYDYPEGLSYYTWMANDKCSSDEPLQEKFDFLTRLLKDLDAYYNRLMDANPDFEGEATIEDLESLEDVISYLQKHMEGFPKGPDVDYSLAYLDDSVSESAMAYYIQSPVDDITENVIHVNKDAVNEINTLYYTLAHEGYPGHLYQLTWFQNTGYNPIRHDLSFMGYEEGWANYVERIMLQRSELDPVSAESIACDEFMSYMIYAGADIAVHGLGYDIAQLANWLEEVGLQKSYASQIYSYVVSYPGLLLPYGYGMAKFWDLRCRTEAALGDDFDLEEFHLQILTNGPRPFELVESDMEKYVASKGKTLPDQVALFENEEIPSESSEPASSTANGYLPWIAGAAVLLAIIVFLVIRNRKKTKEPVEPASEENETVTTNKDNDE